VATRYFSGESINPEKDGHENKQTQRRADHSLFLRPAEAGMPIRETGRKYGFSDASGDNPHLEQRFRAVKYRPEFL
jgi:hypothetical protein